jgi:splicing factor 3B subunit 3
VLEISSKVEEVRDSGFLSKVKTLHVSLLGEDSLLQIYEEGLRHIRADKRTSEWRCPGDGRVVACATNERQVAIALRGGDLFYFELDQAGNLDEVLMKNVGREAEVSAMSIAPLQGQARSRFLSVAFTDNKVRVYSLAASDCMESLAMQILPSKATSLAIVELASMLYLCVGTVKGLLLRARLDEITGQLSDTRTRFLGTKSVKLFVMKLGDKKGLLALSTRSWLCYTYQSRVMTVPLSYVPLEYTACFSSEQCPEGVVGLTKKSLRYVLMSYPSAR